MKHPNLQLVRRISASAFAYALLACSNGPTNVEPTTSEGGNAASGHGGTSATTGGTGSTPGGASAGGTVQTSSSQGAAPSSGGATATGGRTTNVSGGAGNASGGGAIGGAAAGGKAALGGTTSSGGANSVGGSPNAGSPNGGAGTAAGGTSGGGKAASGGTVSSGGAKAVGGASSGGAAPSIGGAAGAGAGGVASCNVEPVTPNATPQTRRVLCYLYSIIGKNILSGQEEDNSNEAMDFVYRVSGKYPAIRAFDLNNSLAPGQCVDHAKKGGLCMFGYHMGINGSYTASVNMTNVITPGTTENKTLNARLDQFAAAFQQLQAVNGVGFVRIFHEVGNGCTWFWWTATNNAQQYNALWKYAFKYLTETKGVKNSIWLLPLCGNSNSGAWNPGKEFVDVGGSDTYKNGGDYQPLTAQFNDTQKSFPGLPIALHENGPIPDPDQLKSAGAKWVLFNTWSDHFNPPNNSEEHTKAVYNHAYVITLDELPSFQ